MYIYHELKAVLTIKNVKQTGFKERKHRNCFISLIIEIIYIVKIFGINTNHDINFKAFIYAKNLQRNFLFYYFLRKIYFND